MANLICWICKDNLSFNQYQGSLIDEDGSKPCVECISEAETLNEDDDEQ